MKLVVNNERFNKLREMNLDVGSKVTLSTEGGAEIIHYTGEDYEGETIDDTGIAYQLAALVASTHLPNNDLIEEMRYNGALDDYERGSFEFEEYVAGVIRGDWYEYMDVNTEHYDHKRGYTNVKAELKLTLGELLKADVDDPSLFSNWEVEVQTPMGALKVG
tara:strand:+ start:557 stop:1042 length:486 start_codon:yes stop_codon:yes gene_type:complete